MDKNNSRSVDNHFIYCGDITEMDMDVIVCPANRALIPGNGLDRTIHKKAGLKLTIRCFFGLWCETAAVFVTKGYALPCRHIFHVPGPKWRGGNSNEEELLRTCYKNIVTKALELEAKTIAIPAISCGIYGFPAALAARNALSVCEKLLAENPGLRIWHVLYGQTMFSVWNEAKMAGTGISYLA
jgi:O-acetyl-ADP-ribose deacetylase (regulator of RNase III)